MAAAAPTASGAPPPTSLHPAPWKSVTVADVTDRAEAQALHRKWEHEHLAPQSEPHGAAGAGSRHAGRRDRLVKTAQTIVVHASFLGAGMYYAIFGPTVQDLAVTMNVGLFRVLFLLAARAFGFFVGAVAGAVFLRPVNPQVLFVLLNFLLAMACLGVSYFDALVPGQLLFALGGFALGAISVIGVLWISALWREASGFLVRTLTFTFCVGCVLGPVLSEPFITDRSVAVRSDSSAAAQLSDLNNLEDRDFIYVAYAYWIISVYAFCVAFVALVAMFVDPRHQDLRDMESQCPVAPCGGFVVLLFFYLAACLAVETVCSQLVAPFALLTGHDKTAATYVTCLFWVAFTTARGVSIACFPQRGYFDVLLLCNVLLMAATGLGAAFGRQARALWVGTAVAGACMAPSVPSTLLLLHDYSGVSNSRFALAMLVAGASSAFAPLCVGARLERQPMLFHQALAALSTVALLLALVGRALLRRMAVEEGYVHLPTDEARHPSYRALKRRE